MSDSSLMADHPSRIHQLLEKAQFSWLSPPEYLEIISSFYPKSNNYDESNPSSIQWVSSMGIEMATSALTSPPTSGTLIVYDKAIMTHFKIKFKNDGHQWKTKNRGSGASKGGTREDTMRLSVPCMEAGRKERKLMGAYAHHVDIDFHRRTYHEVGCVKGPRFDDIHLVHYLGGAKSTADYNFKPGSRPLTQAPLSYDTSAATGITSSIDNSSFIDEEVLSNIDKMFETDGTYHDEGVNSSNVSDGLWENTPFNLDIDNDTKEPNVNQGIGGVMSSGDGQAWSNDSRQPSEILFQQLTHRNDDASYASPGAFQGSHRSVPASPTSSNDGSCTNSSFSISSIPTTEAVGMNQTWSPQPNPSVYQPPLPPHIFLGDSSSTFSGPSIPVLAPVSIIDVSPDWVDCVGGSKLLLVLSSKLNVPVNSNQEGNFDSNKWILQCGFSSSISQSQEHALNDALNLEHEGVKNWRWVEAEMLGESVVRCHVPPHPPGPVSLVVAACFTHQNHKRDLLACGFANKPTMLTYRSLWRSSTSSTSSQSQIKPNSPQFSDSSTPYAKSLSKLPLPQLQVFKGKRFSKQSSLEGASDRESKIRIVHKLEKVESSIAQHQQQQLSSSRFLPNTHEREASSASVQSGSNSLSSATDATMYDSTDSLSAEDNMTHIDERNLSRDDLSGSGDYDALIGLLDDDALTNISDQELEEVLERMLMKVVEQMVQLAASDDDLRGELNAPDKNGMCLLHYAGLYNILPLVPVLLQYGAWIDATAGEQLQTPLHLAACAGHAAVVGSLLLHGADPFCKDALGHDPAAAASYHGHTDAASLVLAAQSTRRKAVQWNRMNDGDGDGYGVDQQMEFFPSSSPSTDHSGLTQQNVAMLQDAFTTLSLKDKCLIRSGVAMLEQVGYDEDDIFHSETADEGVESEVASVITDSDKESLDVAIAMMGPEERVELEKEARVLQKNMKAWMMRRNYKSMRESVRKLQGLWREHRPPKANTEVEDSGSMSSSRSIVTSSLVSIDEGKAMSQGLPTSPKRVPSSPRSDQSGCSQVGGLSCQEGGFSQVGETSEERTVPYPMSDNAEGQGESNEETVNDVELLARIQIQAISRGMLARKNFGRIKQETLAMIVIQRTLLRRRGIRVKK